MKKIDLSNSAKARPFVSPMAWALYSAYSSIVMGSVFKLEILKIGVDSKKLINKEAISKVIKAALPQYTEYIDKYGDAGYHYLLDELEGKLLDEFRNMMAGVEADKASIAKAAEIVKYSNELIESTKKGEVS